MFRAISRVALAVVLGALAPISLTMPVLAVSPNVTLTVSTSPSGQVSPNKGVMFIGEMTYTGFSQSNHATATSSAPGATFLNSWVGGIQCAAESCSLGSLAGGGSVQLLFLYQAPSSGSVTGTVTVTTSESPRGNTRRAGATVRVESNLDLGVATLLPETLYAGLSTVDTGLTSLTTTNTHGTQLTFPGAAAQGTLATISDVPTGCPGTFKSAAKCFGQGSALSVLAGADVATYLKVTSAWGLSEQRNGVSEKTIQIVHIWDDGTAHVISTVCSSEPPADAAALPCRTVGTVTADGTILVTLYLAHNGLIKGW